MGKFYTQLTINEIAWELNTRPSSLSDLEFIRK